MQLYPVWDAASHGPDVNKVKGVVWKCPFLVDIVNLEFAVGRDKAGLDGREIHTEDVSRGMFIGELTIQAMS